LIPFLGHLIKDDLSFINVPLVYSIYLLQQVSSYLFFAYKSAIIQAHQKSYIIQKINSVFIILQGILQIIVLIAFQNFVLYAAIVVGVNLVNNFIIGYQADKLFPYIKESHKNRLSKEERSNLFHNSRALMYHRINKVVLAATDNLLLAKFIGLEIVGLYSNYLLIIATVKLFMSNLFNAVSASLGNLNAEDTNSDSEKKLTVFNSINFMTFVIFGVLAVVIFHTANEFIYIWLGSAYLLDKTFLGLLSLEVYIFGILKMLTTMRDSFGLFQELKYVPLLSGLLNLILSFLLVQKMGISGLLIGTIISSLLTFFIIDPIVLFKKIFVSSPSIYFKKNLLYIIIIIFSSFITTQIASFANDASIVNLFIRLLISIIVPLLVIVLLFSKTKEYKYLYKSALSTLKILVKS
jgi:O-antigen/teichoic acid export membrane protein